MEKIKSSLKNINGRMFIALLIMGLCPTLYTTLRTFFLGQLPGEWSYSIAGQLSWVNLLYEIINEAIILPLYFFMGQAVSDKEEYSNRIRSGLIISLGIYTVCSVLVLIFVEPLLKFMAVSQDILTESASYIRIECIANIFGILYSFICVALITIGKDKLVYAITAAKLILSITAMTCLLWVVTIPLYKPFMQYVLNYSDVDKLFKLVMVLFGFYVLYAFQNVFDATFYGRGKTKYMLFESVVTNSIYYGTFFVLYLCGAWKPTLIGIALMFGCGNAFDTVVSYLAYRYFLKKENISIGFKE